MKKLYYLFLLLALSGCEIYIFDNPDEAYDQRVFFTGNYDVQEYSFTYENHYTYQMSISVVWNSSNEVALDGLYGLYQPVYAVVDYDKLTIPLQQQDGYEIEGTGKLRGTRLELNYVVRDLLQQPVVSDFLEAEARSY